MIITEKTYEETIKDYSGPILFFSNWNSESLQLKNKLYPNVISLAFDIDEAPNVPVELGIDQIPSIAMFKNGCFLKLVEYADFCSNK